MPASSYWADPWGRTQACSTALGWSHQFHPPMEVGRKLKPRGVSRDLAASLPRSPVLTLEAPAVTCRATKGSHLRTFSVEFSLIQHFRPALVCSDVSLLSKVQEADVSSQALLPWDPAGARTPKAPKQSRTHSETEQLESVLCKLFPGFFATKIYCLDFS